MLCVLVVNIYFVAWDDRQRRAELGDKTRRILSRLDSKCHCLSLSLTVLPSFESIGSLQVIWEFFRTAASNNCNTNKLKQGWCSVLPIKQGGALMERNRTGPPCSIGHPTAHAPGPAAADRPRPAAGRPARRQR